MGASQKGRSSEVKQNLRSEIYRRAHYVEPQGDFIEMVLIRMDAIEDAVIAWDKVRRRQRERKTKEG